MQRICMLKDQAPCILVYSFKQTYSINVVQPYVIFNLKNSSFHGRKKGEN